MAGIHVKEAGAGETALCLDQGVSGMGDGAEMEDTRGACGRGRTRNLLMSC